MAVPMIIPVGAQRYEDVLNRLLRGPSSDAVRLRITLRNSPAPIEFKPQVVLTDSMIGFVEGSDNPTFILFHAIDMMEVFS